MKTPTRFPEACPPWHQWRRAVADPLLRQAIGRLYGRLDEQIRHRGPVCWASGRCCRFDQFGHRLYVTGLEIAWVLDQIQRPGVEGQREDSKPRERTVALRVYEPAEPSQRSTGPCPFQVDGLCSIHTVRPLGCRVFFCQRGTEAWQNDLYECRMSELRRLHTERGLPYEYMEWRGGLRAALRNLKEFKLTDRGSTPAVKEAPAVGEDAR